MYNTPRIDSSRLEDNLCGETGFTGTWDVKRCSLELGYFCELEGEWGYIFTFTFISTFYSSSS